MEEGQENAGEDLEALEKELRELEEALAKPKKDKKKKKKKVESAETEGDGGGSVVAEESVKKVKKSKVHAEDAAVNELLKSLSSKDKTDDFVPRRVPPPKYSYDDELSIPKKRHLSYWKKPPTIVYKDNFGFGVNGYQPMIEYLDYKDSGGKAKQELVHLPFSEERCMTKYHAQKPFRQYDNKDIDSYIDKGEKIRTQIRQNDAAGASNVLSRTHTKWSMTAKYVQLVKNSYIDNYNKKKVDEDDLPVVKKDSDFHYKSPQAGTVKVLSPKLINNCLVMDVGDVLSMISHSKTDHEYTMAARRERQKQIDYELDETLARTSANNRIYNASVPQPYHNAVNFTDVLNVTDDLIERNHFRRQREMSDLNQRVNETSMYDVSRNQLRNKLRAMDDDIIAMDDDLNAMRKKHRNERIQMGALGDLAAAGSVGAYVGSKPVLHGVSPYYEDAPTPYNRIKKEYLPTSTPDFDAASVVEMQRPRHPKTDQISDVQTRIIGRANEIQGVTNEYRKIHNMARFANYTKRGNQMCSDTDVSFRPSRTEQNIDYMAKTLSETGRSRRKYAVEDEGDRPVSNINTNCLELYCTKSRVKPVDLIPSNSSMVRNAAMQARFRNCLLNN